MRGVKFINVLVFIILLGVGSIFTFVGSIIGVTFMFAFGGDMMEMILPIIFVGMGLIFIGISVPPIVKTIKENKRKKWLLQNGRVIYATVDSVERKSNYMINGRNPFIIHAKYEDEGIITSSYRFQSDMLLIDRPEDILPGDTVKVYIDGNDFSKYAMDESSLV